MRPWHLMLMKTAARKIVASNWSSGKDLPRHVWTVAVHAATGRLGKRCGLRDGMSALLQRSDRGLRDGMVEAAGPRVSRRPHESTRLPAGHVEEAQDEEGGQQVDEP